MYVYVYVYVYIYIYIYIYIYSNIWKYSFYSRCKDIIIINYSSLLFSLNCYIATTWHFWSPWLKVIVLHSEKKSLTQMSSFTHSCHYKPVWLTFVFHRRKKRFWRMWITKKFWFILNFIVFFVHTVEVNGNQNCMVLVYFPFKCKL